jgi:hypothetical protein
MLLWISLFGGLALILAMIALMLSMGRAERRARRSLYRALGLAEATVDFLMKRNRDVLAELNYVRRQGEAGIRRDVLSSIGVAPLRPTPRSVGEAPTDGDGPAQPGARGAPPPDGHTRH